MHRSASVFSPAAQKEIARLCGRAVNVAPVFTGARVAVEGKEVAVGGMKEGGVVEVVWGANNRAVEVDANESGEKKQDRYKAQRGEPPKVDTVARIERVVIGVWVNVTTVMCADGVQSITIRVAVAAFAAMPLIDFGGSH